MSITLEQANCIHDFDDTFRCIKCGYHDLMLEQYSEVECFGIFDDKVQINNNEQHYMCSNPKCTLCQCELSLPKKDSGYKCSECDEELEEYN